MRASSLARLATLAVALAAGTSAASERIGVPWSLSVTHEPGDRFMGIRLLGALDLDGARIGEHALHGLSGLAFDADDDLLYAVSDRGVLFVLQPEIASGMLAGVEAVAAHPLRDRRGRVLQGVWRDAEGLDVERARNGVRGDATLVIAFEHRMRVARYATDGRLLEYLALPEMLELARTYASVNRALESLAVHPRLGPITAPERPPRGAAAGETALHALRGGSWAYPLADTPNNGLVAIEALPDGSLLTIERGYGLMLLPIVITLRLVPAPMRSPVEPRTMAVLDSSRGWSVDNFEGLARHRGRTFFTVSDDNAKPYQRTLLVRFGLLDESVPPGTDGRNFESLQRIGD